MRLRRPNLPPTVNLPSGWEPIKPRTTVCLAGCPGLKVPDRLRFSFVLWNPRFRVLGQAFFFLDGIIIIVLITFVGIFSHARD